MTIRAGPTLMPMFYTPSDFFLCHSNLCHQIIPPLKNGSRYFKWVSEKPPLIWTRANHLNVSNWILTYLMWGSLSVCFKCWIKNVYFLGPSFSAKKSLCDRFSIAYAALLEAVKANESFSHSIERLEKCQCSKWHYFPFVFLSTLSTVSHFSHRSSCVKYKCRLKQIFFPSDTLLIHW